MKTSVSLFLTDILPHKRRTFHKIVKNNIFGSLPVSKAVPALKSSGVEGIELFLPSFFSLHYRDIEDVKRVLGEHDMPVLSVHQKIRFLTKTKIAEIIQLFHIAEMLSSRVIVLHMNTAGKQLFDADYIATLHSLEKKYNIKIGFENREKYFGSLHARYGWDAHLFPALMKKTDFAMTLDTTHLAVSGGDIIDFFQKHKERIINIHLSDFKHDASNSSLRPFHNKHLPLGEGTLPIKQFIALLKKEAYRGYITMEIHTDLAGICESAGLIRKYREEAN